MELVDVARILRRRWLPLVAVWVVVAGLFALFPTRMMPLPPSTAVTEVTLRLEVGGTDAATIAAHRTQLDTAATEDSTLVEARNLANVTPEYMKTGAKLTWRGPTTFDVTFTGPEREPTLELAKDYTELVGRLDAKVIPGITITASSTRDVIANQRVLPEEEKLGRLALSVPLGVIGGLIAGLAVAFALNALDKRVRGVADLPTRGLTDAQELGRRSPERIAAVLSGRGVQAVSVLGVGCSDAALVAVAEALQHAGIELDDDAPALLAVGDGALKEEVRDALDATPELVGVALLAGASDHDRPSGLGRSNASEASADAKPRTSSHPSDTPRSSSEDSESR